MLAHKLINHLSYLAYDPVCSILFQDYYNYMMLDLHIFIIVNYKIGQKGNKLEINSLLLFHCMYPYLRKCMLAYSGLLSLHIEKQGNITCLLNKLLSNILSMLVHSYL